MTAFLWGVEHRNDDGTEVGIVEFGSEMEARNELRHCITGGQPCELLRRGVTDWQVTE